MVAHDARSGPWGQQQIVEVVEVADDVEVSEEARAYLLLEAARDNDLDMVLAVLEQLPVEVVNGRLAGGQTPLLVACALDHAEVVAALLDHGADPTVGLLGPDNSETPPLAVAAIHGFERTCLVLLEAGVDQAAYRDPTGCSPLMSAAFSGHARVVSALLQYADAAEINYGNRTTGATAVRACCETGKEEVLGLLLAAGASPSTTDATNGETVLMCAAQGGHEGMCAKLLDAGAEVDAVDHCGLTALWCASQHGRFGVISLLVGAGANVNHRSKLEGAGPLFVACQNGHYTVAKMLIERGAVVNTDPGPLFIATQSGHADIVDLLLQTPGVEPDRVNHDGSECTPLCAAAGLGYAGLVSALADAGAVVNYTRTAGGATPLYVAAQKGLLGVVRVLVSKGADVNLAEAMGYTPLYVASWKGRLETMLFLIESGAQPNKASVFGWTPLRAAAEAGNLEATHVLLHAGADPSLGGPLQVAVLHRHVEVAAALLRAGAPGPCHSGPALLLAGHLQAALVHLRLGGPSLDLGEAEMLLQRLVASGAKVCAFCASDDGIRLRCGKCKSVLYCSAGCQKAHWRAGHRGACSSSLRPLEEEEDELSGVQELLELRQIVQPTERIEALLLALPRRADCHASWSAAHGDLCSAYCQDLIGRAPYDCDLDARLAVYNRRHADAGNILMI